MSVTMGEEIVSHIPRPLFTLFCGRLPFKNSLLLAYEAAKKSRGLTAGCDQPSWFSRGGVSHHYLWMTMLPPPSTVVGSALSGAFI